MSGAPLDVTSAERRFDVAMQRAAGAGIAVAGVCTAAAATLGRELYPAWWWAIVGPALVLLLVVAVICSAGARCTPPQVCAYAVALAVLSTATAAAAGDAVPDVGTAVLPVVVVTVLVLGFVLVPRWALLTGAFVIAGNAVVPIALRPAEAFDYLIQAVIQALILVAAAAGGAAARQLAAAEESAAHQLLEALAADRAAATVAAQRREVRRQLHDTVLSTLTALGRGHLDDAVETRARCLHDVRYLRTRGDEERGCWTEQLAAVAAACRRSGFEIDLDGSARATDLVPARVATAVARAAREALNNAHEHSGCSWVQVTYDGDADGVVVRVVDQGTGLAAPDTRRMGIRESLQARMAGVGGAALIDAVVGVGTVVELRWQR